MKQVKKWDKYTDLMLTVGKFKRPKVWSNTRLVIYEFEMLERFHPEKSLTLANVHRLAMYVTVCQIRNN